ncbi:MAG TPA: ATP-binding protein, partial [Trueperaceae bacterium]|nr:ATP-binding protein [Trueperaceae bacterium]
GLRAVRRLGQEPELPFTTKQVLLRVAQEALHNVVKHASASTVTVRAAVEAEAGSPGAPATEAEAPAGPTLRLEVVDDGVGFDTSLAYPGHLGLTSMQERVAALGGTLSIESAQGAGTSVTVIVPVSPPTGSEP